jgi:hypothetical protein
VSPGKHGPNRLRNYLAVHSTIMQQLLQGGFVLSEGLSLSSDGTGGVIISGRVFCRGGIYVDVRKKVARVAGEGGDPVVQTSDYSYNVVLGGRGNIFRYDSPHPDHNREHHVHRYDVLTGDTQGSLDFIYSEDEIPTL